jgi:hypothetical protein
MAKKGPHKGRKDSLGIEVNEEYFKKLRESKENVDFNYMNGSFLKAKDGYQPCYLIIDGVRRYVDWYSHQSLYGGHKDAGVEKLLDVIPEGPPFYEPKLYRGVGDQTIWLIDSTSSRIIVRYISIDAWRLYGFDGNSVINVNIQDIFAWPVGPPVPLAT